MLNKTLLSVALIVTSFQINASELSSYLNNLHTFKSNFVQLVFASNNESKTKK